ncbi:MAG: hypothetical protein IPJ45_09385 [Ignavibacteria bacterium]|nr:hypothetical protein [Ignavibacteria bacterium]
MFGLETMISQNDRKKLTVTNHKLKNLIEFIKKQSKTNIEDKRKWQKLLGLAQKNYIQNISYQKEITLLELRNSLKICDQSIINLTDSKDIQGRIEAIRFKARIYFRIYNKTKDIQELENALAQTKKVIFAFFIIRK